MSEVNNTALPDKVVFGKNSYGGIRSRVIETNVQGLYIDKSADWRMQSDGCRRTVWDKEWVLWFFRGCKSYTKRNYKDSEIIFKGNLKECKRKAQEYLKKLKATEADNVTTD